MSKFRRARGHCEVFHKNKVPVGVGIDADIEESLTGGICAGITVTWIAGVLNGYEEAVDTDRFADYFDNVLRFQGTYLQALGKRIATREDFVGGEEKEKPDTSEIMFEKLAEMLAHGCDKFDYKHCKADTLRVRKAYPSYEERPLWAAYVSIFHHAIGIAQLDAGKRFFIMDPNKGLYSYGHDARFRDDLCDYIGDRIKSLVKTKPKGRGQGLYAGSEFTLTFWAKKT